jgi:hypothetical protein
MAFSYRRFDSSIRKIITDCFGAVKASVALAAEDEGVAK